MAAALAGVFGLVVGSFCTVVVWRVPRGESVVSPASACPHCGAPVPPWLNVPVLAWLALRGRARCCGAAISVRYPLVEASVAVLWVLLAATTQPAWLLAVVLPFAAGAVCVTAIDLDCYRIPHPISATLAVCAVAGAAVVAVAVDDPPAGSGWSALWVPLACGAAATALLWTLRFLWPGSMGGGDVYFVFSVIAVPVAAAGPGAALVAAMTALMSASVAGVAVVAVRARQGRRTPEDRRIPFGPFLALGALVAAIWGAPLWSTYTNLWT